MKKFLLILILCIIKLNAYEYLIYYNYDAENQSIRDYILLDVSDILKIKYVRANNSTIGSYADQWRFMQPMSNIKFSVNDYYISKNTFDSYLKNDPIFLNQFYLQQTQTILNYFYNNRPFVGSNYVKYENYELLYNSDGLAVESIVNGEWAGLYDRSNLSNSGYLYSSNGSLKYVNGEPANFFQKIWTKLSNPIIDNFENANNGLMPLNILMAFLIVFALFFFCVRLFKVAFKGEKWKI